MPRHSPHTVTYKDLLVFAEGQEVEAKSRLAGARARGTNNLDALTHHLEVTKTLHRMLKKGLPGKQTDMLALFEQTR
jgi:hypothetical protein